MRKFFVLIFFVFSFVLASEVEDVLMPEVDRCIKERDAKSCNYLASIIMFQFKTGILLQKDAKIFDTAIKLFSISCDESDSPMGCLMLALIYSGDLDYLPGIKDRKLYLTYLDKACSLNNGYACYRLGLALAYKNDQNTIPLFRKGCELGNQESCNQFLKLK